MTTKIMENNRIHYINDNSVKKTVKTSSDNTPKVDIIFKKEISDPAQTATEDEREAFIEFYMKEKKVSRVVAAAEYDFFI